MMYMSDAINATLNIMTTEAKNVKIRSSYNIAELVSAQKKFQMKYKEIFPNFQ